MSTRSYLSWNPSLYILSQQGQPHYHKLLNPHFTLLLVTLFPHLPKKFTDLGSNTPVHSRSYPTPLKAQNLSGSQAYANLMSPPCESHHRLCHCAICATFVLSSYSNCHPHRVAISGRFVRSCDGGEE